MEQKTENKKLDVVEYVKQVFHVITVAETYWATIEPTENYTFSENYTFLVRARDLEMKLLKKLESRGFSIDSIFYHDSDICVVVTPDRFHIEIGLELAKFNN